MTDLLTLAIVGVDDLLAEDGHEMVADHASSVCSCEDDGFAVDGAPCVEAWLASIDSIEFVWAEVPTHLVNSGLWVYQVVSR